MSDIENFPIADCQCRSITPSRLMFEKFVEYGLTPEKIVTNDDEVLFYFFSDEKTKKGESRWYACVSCDGVGGAIYMADRLTGKDHSYGIRFGDDIRMIVEFLSGQWS